jgi:hypothetical protein
MKILVAVVLALSFVGPSFAQEPATSGDQDQHRAAAPPAVTTPAVATTSAIGAISPGVLVGAGAVVAVAIAVGTGGGDDTDHTGGGTSGSTGTTGTTH